MKHVLYPLCQIALQIVYLSLACMCMALLDTCFSGFSLCHLFYREDWEFLVRNEALPEERMRSVETGGCPHAAIREVN